MNRRWDPRAIQDVNDIHRYIAANGSEGAAERVRQHLHARIDQLRGHPYLGRKSSNPEIRILAATRYPYLIYYAVESDNVVILHIRHTSRQAPDDLGQ